MRPDQKFHYFTTDEVRLLFRIAHDMALTLQANPNQETCGEFPRQRVEEWMANLNVHILNKRSKLVG